MQRTIEFKGQLAQFGQSWSVPGESIAEDFKLIECQTPGFRKFLLDAVESGLDIAIVSEKDTVVSDPSEVFISNLAKDEKLYVALMPAGSAKGWGLILAAVILAVVTYGASLAYEGAVAGTVGGAFISAGYAVAVSLALQGITQLLSKNPKTKDEEDGPGIFNGADNTVEAGKPVPLLYGKLLVGGLPIHVDVIRATGYTPPLSLPFPTAANTTYTNRPPTGADPIVISIGTGAGLSFINFAALLSASETYVSVSVSGLIT